MYSNLKRPGSTWCKSSLTHRERPHSATEPLHVAIDILGKTLNNFLLPHWGTILIIFIYSIYITSSTYIIQIHWLLLDNSVSRDSHQPKKTLAPPGMFVVMCPWVIQLLWRLSTPWSWCWKGDWMGWFGWYTWSPVWKDTSYKRNLVKNCIVILHIGVKCKMKGRRKISEKWCTFGKAIVDDWKPFTTYLIDS